MADLTMVARVRKAPGCPHYITEARFAEMAAIVGASAVGTIRCPFCYETPVLRFGAFNRPGQRSDTPRVNRRAAKPQRRDMVERGRVA